MHNITTQNLKEDKNLFIEEPLLKNEATKTTISSEALPSLLGNREIRWEYEKIYQKYLRKHIAQYALTVGNSRLLRLSKNQRKTRLSKSEFNTNLSFGHTLKTINQSLCSCGRDAHFQNVSKIVDIKETEKSRRLKGLKSCGNNAACPVCAAKLSAIRGNQLKELMSTGRKNGRSYMMIVSTIPHQPSDPLEITLNQVIDMDTYIFQDDEYRKFKKITQCRFVDGGLEIMVSFKNGFIDWHPHKNHLLDFDISTEEIIKKLGLKNELEFRLYVSKLFTSLGQKYLNKQGIKKILRYPRFEPDLKTKRIHVKGGITASLEFEDEYITKWGLDAEMTSGIYKNGRFDGSIDAAGNLVKSFHPFTLLDFINQDNLETSKDFKYQCIMAFQEFVVASKGKWWFYFGRGAIAYYNANYDVQLKVKKDAEELISLEDDGDLIYSMSNEEWQDFKPTPKKVGKALSLPTRKDVLEYIFAEIEKNRIRKLDEIGQNLPNKARRRLRRRDALASWQRLRRCLLSKKI